MRGSVSLSFLSRPITSQLLPASVLILCGLSALSQRSGLGIFVLVPNRNFRSLGSAPGRLRALIFGFSAGLQVWSTLSIGSTNVFFYAVT